MNIIEFTKTNITPNLRDFHDMVATQKFDAAGEIYLKIVEEIQSASAIYSKEKNHIAELNKLQSELWKQLEAKNVAPVILSSKDVHPEAIKEFAPVGIVNQGNDCPSNSIVQMISNSPSLARKILGHRNTANLKAFSSLIQQYYAAQMKGQPVSDIYSQKIRKELFPTSNFFEQCDVSEGLEKVLRELKFGFNKFEGIEKEKENLRLLEPVMRVDIPADHSTMQTMVNGFFSPKLKFENSPKDLIIQTYRFGQRQGYSIKNFESFQISSDQTRWAEPTAQYDLVSCIVHLGLDNQGHYVTLLKKPEGWYLANDSKVTLLSNQKAKEYLEKGYLFHYEKRKAGRSCIEKVTDLYHSTINYLSYTYQAIRGLGRPATKTD